MFPLCVLFVFLVLAAQYESLTLPLAIILIVPMCLLAAITGVLLDHGDNNVFTQVGLIVLVGPRLQERDPDRGVRQASGRGAGPRCGVGGAGGRPAAAAPDPDDVVSRSSWASCR